MIPDNLNSKSDYVCYRRINVIILDINLGKIVPCGHIPDGLAPIQRSFRNFPTRFREPIFIHFFLLRSDYNITLEGVAESTYMKIFYIRSSQSSSNV